MSEFEVLDPEDSKFSLMLRRASPRSPLDKTSSFNRVGHPRSFNRSAPTEIIIGGWDTEPKVYLGLASISSRALDFHLAQPCWVPEGLITPAGSLRREEIVEGEG